MRQFIVFLIEYIKPDVKIIDIYNIGLNFIRKNKKELEKYLNKSFGHSTGLE